MRDPLGTLIALMALWLLVAAIVLWLTRVPQSQSPPYRGGRTVRQDGTEVSETP
jgi:hypothetical protein